MDLQDLRDIIIIAAGSLTILVLLALFVFTIVLGLGARALIAALRSTLRDELNPLLHSARQTVRTVQGTTTFVGETTVKPIIRVYGAIAGARRMAGVLTGIVGRRSNRD